MIDHGRGCEAGTQAALWQNKARVAVPAKVLDAAWAAKYLGRPLMLAIETRRR